MLLNQFKKLVKELGLTKAMALVDGMEIVDADGTPVDIEAIDLKSSAPAEDEGDDGTEQEGMDEKAIAATVAKAVGAEIAKLGDKLDRKAIITGGEGRNDEAHKMGGFKSQGEYYHAVKLASTGQGVDKRLEGLRGKASASTYANEGAGADGGYLVPGQVREQIWMDIFGDEDSFLSQLSQEPTSGNSIELAADETTPWGSTGIQAYWTNEAAAATQSKPSLQERNIKLHKLTALVPASQEVLDDAPRLQNHLQVKAPQALNYKLLDAVVNGTGVGQPLGYRTSTAHVTVAKETSQTATTVNANNVAKMYARVINPGRAVWRCNQDVLPQLLTMTLGDNSIFVPPASGFANAPGGFLFGRPVQFSEVNQTLGAEGDIDIVDPQGYALVTKQGGGVDFQSSIHLWFDQSLTAFRWTIRAGGAPYLSAPVSPGKGSSTRSHFVNLAVRS